MNITEEQRCKQNEIRDIAKAILANNIHPIDGIRQINALRYETGEGDNEIFYPIIAFDSESDTFPLGEYRTKCASEYLDRKDSEMEEFLLSIKNSLAESCQALVDYFARS